MPQVRATQTGYLLEPDGPERYVMENDTFDSGDLLVTTHPDWFAPVEEAKPAKADEPGPLDSVAV